jgi:hypothetical protein
MGILLCALATRELPELTRLVDNTSNDYSTTIFQKSSTPTVTHQAPAVARYILTSVRTLEFVPAMVDSKPIEFLSPPADLLHLLCTQRT